MTDILAGVGIAILSIALLIGGIMFTVFLILNEKKLKETKSTPELKKMYRNAIYLSLLIVIIGIITYVLGIYRRHCILWMDYPLGWTSCHCIQFSRSLQHIS